LSERAADALVGLLPAREPEIRTALQGWSTEIDALDSSIRRRLSAAEARRFLVQHAAWGRYAEAYDLEQLSILSHAGHGNGDRGAAQLAEVIDTARRTGMRVVIVQPQVNQEAARMVAAEVGAQVREVDPLSRNPLDALAAITDAVMEGGAK
jgi:zinc transport system substrate-binding protein